jgi:hypothetical protein
VYVTDVLVMLLKVPQAAPAHPVPERVQLTPWFCESFCIDAVKFALAETCTEVDVGLTETVMDRRTAKLTPLLAVPPTVTTTFPVVAPVGTAATMLVALQLVAVAAVPLNVTVLVPWVAPKFAPVIVTLVPTSPDVGLKLVMLGAGAAVTVTLADAVFVVSAFDTADTSKVAGDGTAAGAVYSPFTVTVPNVGVPPVTPFTCQLTP